MSMNVVLWVLVSSTVHIRGDLGRCQWYCELLRVVQLQVLFNFGHPGGLVCEV